MNWIDLTVFGILGASALVSLFRGFTKEVLTFVGWFGAIAFAVYALPVAQPTMRQIIDSEIIGDIVAAVVLFVLAAFILGLITHWISKAVHGMGLGAVDRSLGVVFGLARGALFIVLAFYLATLLIGDDEPPETLMQARTLPWLQQGAGLLTEILPEEYAVAMRSPEQSPAAIGPPGGEDPRLRGLSEDEAMPGELMDRIDPDPEPAAEPGTETDTGYAEQERRTLERLFETAE